jgi:hypothetical protein
MIAVRVSPRRSPVAELGQYAALTPPVVIAAAVGLVVGLWSGATAVSTPVIQAPSKCTVALNEGVKAFDAYEEQVIAIHNRATRGLSEFAGHDATVTRLWNEIDEAKTAYAAAGATCLGDS